MTARSAVRQAAYRLAAGLGVNRLVASSPWRHRRLLILCYHGFSLDDEHRWNPELYIRPETFRRRLITLREQGFRVLPLGEAVALLATGTLPRRAVAVTVDDGSKNFLAGYAVLRDLQVPVTLYVSTYYVEKRLPVFNGCASYLLWRGAEMGTILTRQPWLAEPVSLRGRWLSVFHDLLRFAEGKGLDAEAKHALLPGLAAEVGVDFDDLVARGLFHLLAPAELAALAPALVDVQLHTHRHRTPEAAPLLEREIQDNRDALARCGRPPGALVHFCYPSGVYRRDQLPVLQALGIRSATTCVPGLASAAGDPLLLPRFIDNEGVSEPAFRAWLAGTGHLLRLGRRS